MENVKEGGWGWVWEEKETKKDEERKKKKEEDEKNEVVNAVFFDELRNMVFACRRRKTAIYAEGKTRRRFHISFAF